MLAMPSAHRQALRLHYTEFPHGDFRTQQLLAQLIIMFHAANKESKAKPLELKDVAPWLVTASAKKAQRERQEQGVRTMLLGMVSNANT